MRSRALWAVLKSLSLGIVCRAFSDPRRSNSTGVGASSIHLSPPATPLPQQSPKATSALSLFVLTTALHNKPYYSLFVGVEAGLLEAWLTYTRLYI